MVYVHNVYYTFLWYINNLFPQIMAIVVIVLGLVVSTPFQIFVRENAAIKLPTLKWYKWLRKPEFYLVSVVILLASKLHCFRDYLYCMHPYNYRAKCWQPIHTHLDAMAPRPGDM